MDDIDDDQSVFFVEITIEDEVVWEALDRPPPQVRELGVVEMTHSSPVGTLSSATNDRSTARRQRSWRLDSDTET